MDYDDHSKPEGLQEVFDAIDTERKGYITVDHFVSLARDHFGADAQEEPIRKIISLLDKNQDGTIHFQNFCQGIRQITELTSPSSPPVCHLIPSLISLDSQETLVPTENGDEVSEMFSEYDMLTDDDRAQANVSMSSSVHSPLGSEDNGSGKSSELQDQGREETYYHNGLEDSMNCDSDSRVSSSRPLHLRKPTGSSAIASHLLRNASQNASFRSVSSTALSRKSSFSDEFFDDIDGSFTELSDKVKQLEEEVDDLKQKKKDSDSKQSRVKDENNHLVERRMLYFSFQSILINMLEEQVREVEYNSEHQLQLERKKHRDLLAKSEKERLDEVELLTQRLQIVDNEYGLLKEEVPTLRIESERLKKENTDLFEKLYEAEHQLEVANKKYGELHERAAEERDRMEQERHCHGQILDELTKELEKLRIYKVDHPHLSRSDSQGIEKNERQQYEQHIMKLQEQLAQLREHNEELHAQLLSQQVSEGRQLVQGAASLAHEINDMPRHELLQSLEDYQQVTKKLQAYIDRILLKIMNDNPSLLEI